jgi:hypothetical protein
MAVHVFVSYSEKDRLAATLVSTLRGNPNIRIFIAHQFRSPGMSIRQKVDLAIEQSQLFLLLWSGRSESSEWVSYEVETALRLGRRILPVLVEDVELPAGIRDIEAVPLYQDPDRWMQWLASHVNGMAAPARAGFTWATVAKAGLAAVVGLAAAWSESKKESEAGADQKPAKAQKKKRSPSKRNSPQKQRRHASS